MNLFEHKMSYVELAYLKAANQVMPYYAKERGSLTWKYLGLSFPRIDKDVELRKIDGVWYFVVDYNNEERLKYRYLLNDKIRIIMDRWYKKE